MGNGLKDRETILTFYLSTLAICAITVRMIFSENGILNLIGFYVIVFAIITLIFICFIRYNNILKFYFISLIVIIIFPLVHQVLFRYTYDNYVFNEEYLIHTKHQTAILLAKNRSEKKLFKILETLPKNIKEKYLFHENFTSKIPNNDGYILIDSNRPNSITAGGIARPKPAVEFYDRNSKRFAVIFLESGQIQNELDSRRIYNKNLEKKLQNPKLDIHFFDIWLDAITVFIFSNIKPIGRITQIIQLFQVFFTFIFGYMLATFLDNFQQLKITKKETKNE